MGRVRKVYPDAKYRVGEDTRDRHRDRRDIRPLVRRRGNELYRPGAGRIPAHGWRGVEMIRARNSPEVVIVDARACAACLPTGSPTGTARRNRLIA